MLRVVTDHQPPFVSIEESQNGSAPQYSGFLVELLPMLLQQAHINSSYTLYTTSSGGVQLRNGSWTGVMGELVAGRADLALFPLTLTAKRQQYIQHTQPFMDGGYGILVKAEQVDTGYSFLLSFDSTTWAMVLVAMVVVTLLLAVLDMVTRKARLAAIERSLGKAKKERHRKRERLMGHAIEMIMMAMNSGQAPNTRSCAVKIMFVAWAIFCVIMLSAYTANLTAKLTVNQLAAPVQTLADLALTSSRFAVPLDSTVTTYFVSSVDKYARMLRPRMVEYKSVEQAVNDVRQGRIAAYITDYVAAQYSTQVPPCGLALGTEVVGSGSLVIGLKPNSTLEGPLAMAMLQLAESGVIPELKRKWFTDASECKDQAAADGRISIAQVWSVFLILALGSVAGIIAAVLEVVYHNKIFEGVHKLRQNISRRRQSRSSCSRATEHDGGSPVQDLECPTPPGLASEVSLAGERSPVGDKQQLGTSARFQRCSSSSEKKQLQLLPPPPQ